MSDGEDRLPDFFQVKQAAIKALENLKPEGKAPPPSRISLDIDALNSRNASETTSIGPALARPDVAPLLFDRRELVRERWFLFEMASIGFDAMGERYAYLALDYARESRTEPQTSAEIDAEIKKIKDHGKPLLGVLRRMRGPTIRALNATIGERRGQTLLEIEAGLNLLVDAAVLAEPCGGKDTMGPEPARAAHKIACQAADDYFKITGRLPVRSRNRGGFPDLVSTLLDACGVQEKLSSLLQKAVDAWKATHRCE
jgi:hypothetical protein